MNFSLLYQEQFPDDVTHITLHPVDNRIFVYLFDGTISVLDPNNYSTIHTDTYPGVNGNANYMRFFELNEKYIIGGYDDGSNPYYYTYFTDNYTLLQNNATSTGTYTSFQNGINILR